MLEPYALGLIVQRVFETCQRNVYASINTVFCYILAKFLQFLKGDNLLTTKLCFCQKCLFRGVIWLY